MKGTVAPPRSLDAHPEGSQPPRRDTHAAPWRGLLETMRSPATAPSCQPREEPPWK